MNHIQRFESSIHYFVHKALAEPGLDPETYSRKVLLALTKEKNSPIEEKQIAQYIQDRNLKYILHFTHINNLALILRHGLIPRKFLENKDIKSTLKPKFADNQRLEGFKVANSLSISFPDYSFPSKISEKNGENWAVILFNLKAMLKHKCNYNPGDISKVRSGLEGLEEMFADPEKRNELKLDRCFPTNPMSEVYEYSVIPPSWIEEVHLYTEKFLYAAIGWGSDHGIRVNVDQKFFKPRKDHYSWLSLKSYEGTGKPIDGDAHWEALTSAIENSNNTLCILSGWIRSNVIDDIFPLLGKALERGVKIYIAYGYKYKGREHKGSDEEAINKLMGLKNQEFNEGKLYIAKPSKGIHDKIVVVDTKYTINGSNNWLSNKSFSNSESSINFASKDCALDQLHKIKNKYFQLREDQFNKKVDLSRDAKPKTKFTLDNKADENLFQDLRTHRQELASEQKVPPFIIFHDTTLLEMVEKRPKTIIEFGRLSGVGQTKLERYAVSFLEVILREDKKA